MRRIQIRSALNLYIGVNETESILLSPMRFVLSFSLCRFRVMTSSDCNGLIVFTYRSLCISTWTRLHSFVSSHLSEEDQSIAAIPSLSHIHSIIRG